MAGAGEPRQRRSLCSLPPLSQASLCIFMSVPFFALTRVYHISLVGILPSLA